MSDTLPPNIGPSTSDAPVLNIGPTTGDTLPPNIGPADAVISTSCDPLTRKTGDGTPCEVDLSATTTTVAVITPTPALPTTGASADVAVIGSVVLVLGVIAHRISRRRPISR